MLVIKLHGGQQIYKILLSIRNQTSKNKHNSFNQLPKNLMHFAARSAQTDQLYKRHNTYVFGIFGTERIFFITLESAGCGSSIVLKSSHLSMVIANKCIHFALCVWSWCVDSI